MVCNSCIQHQSHPQNTPIIVHFMANEKQFKIDFDIRRFIKIKTWLVVPRGKCISDACPWRCLHGLVQMQLRTKNKLITWNGQFVWLVEMYLENTPNATTSHGIFNPLLYHALKEEWRNIKICNSRTSDIITLTCTPPLYCSLLVWPEGLGIFFGTM